MKDDILEINAKYVDPSINIALDTIKRGKQALFFVNTKPSAEKLAEEISKKIKDVELKELSEKIENALSKPTVQCKRLAAAIKKGIAFHHAGLVSKQRELIEDNFKKGKIKVICSTPTLSIGIDLPAFRAVIRDLKRYGGRWGMQPIPVLEYQQMAGRAGRPSYDSWGEAITIAKSEPEKEDIIVNYINADSENIYSKLAVEPVLRTYLLSLIASGFVRKQKEIIEFFEKTFWAYQYKDMYKLEMIIEKMLESLNEWKFIITNGRTGGNDSADEFVSADSISKNSKNGNNDTDISYRATRLGQRIADLYIDPYTAHILITAMNNSMNKNVVLFSILQMICNTFEMRPLLTVRTKEYDLIQSALGRYEDNLLFIEPSAYDMDYDDFLASIKTAMFMQEWCDEKDEEYLLEKYKVRPGEIRAKLERGDWLLYACIEIGKIISLTDFTREMNKARIRLKNGVKEELIPLLKLKGIGRVRARKMHKNGLKNLGDVRKIDEPRLAIIIGKATAKQVKNELGQESEEPISDRKRKGQMGLGKYS